MNTLQNIDSNGVINPAYYKTACIDIIERTAAERGIDLNKITSNQLKSLLRECYYTLFKPEKNSFPNYRCNIPYTTDNITALLELYIDLNDKYNCIPSLFGFERFCGITEDTTLKYVTGSRLELLKLRKLYIQNKLTESPVGVIALANNDQDSGLMYNRQNIVDHETIKQGLTVNDFVKISDKSSV